MSSFSGNTSTTSVSTAANTSSSIISFFITKIGGAGAVTVNVGIFYGSTISYILSAESIASGSHYEFKGGEILVPANYQIFISASSSCDFYFTLQPSNK